MNDGTAKLEGLAILGGIALATILVGSWPVRPPEAPTLATAPTQVERPFHLPPDRPIDRPTDRPTGRSTDRPTDRSTDPPTHRPTDLPADGPTDLPVVEAPARDRFDLASAPIVVEPADAEIAIVPPPARGGAVTGAFKTTGRALGSAFRKTGARFSRAF